MSDRLQVLQVEFVKLMPAQLEHGKLYISKQFTTAIHLCCCGCGYEVVTPLKSGFWQLTEKDGLVSLSPSIGNQAFDCQSHYWIKQNTVQWLGK